jgi:hypothetical protein
MAEVTTRFVTGRQLCNRERSQSGAPADEHAETLMFFDLVIATSRNES